MIKLESLMLVLEIAKTLLPADLYENILYVAVEWTVENYNRQDAVKAYARLGEEEIVTQTYVEQGLY